MRQGFCHFWAVHDLCWIRHKPQTNLPGQWRDGTVMVRSSDGGIYQQKPAMKQNYIFFVSMSVQTELEL